MNPSLINSHARSLNDGRLFAGKGRGGLKSLLLQCSDGLPGELILSLEAVRQMVPEHHWQIFEMYLIENQSSRQVAERFNTTHFNVRVIAHRIRKRVIESYQGLDKAQRFGPIHTDVDKDLTQAVPEAR